MNVKDVVLNPCSEDVERACAQFDADNKTLEQALGNLFRHFPGNTDLADVYLKVTALNALYGTQIPVYSDRIPTVWEVANHIAGLVIDPDLARGADDLVYKMARVLVAGKADRYNYSFATKYCSWHRPESYPIFDSRVSAYLWHLQKHGCLSRFHQEKLWVYPALKRIVIEFRDKFGLGEFTFKQIDKFLYYQGGVLFSQKEKPSDAAVSELQDVMPVEVRENGLELEPINSSEEYLLGHGYTPEQIETSRKKFTASAGWVVGGRALEDTK